MEAVTGVEYTNKRITLRKSDVFGWIIWSPRGWEPLDQTYGRHSLKMIRQHVSEPMFPQEARDYVEQLIANKELTLVHENV